VPTFLGVREHRVDPALHRVFASELPRASGELGQKADVDPLRGLGRACYAAHARARSRTRDFHHHCGGACGHPRGVIERPELFDHPLFVEEPVTLFERCLHRSQETRASMRA
jgi:hypothetical protein